MQSFVSAPRHGQIDLLGVPIDNLTMAEAVAQIVKRLHVGPPCQVCFVNAHCANVACIDGEYATILRSAALVLPDGIGVKMGTRWLGGEIRDNVNGTDLFPNLCAALSASGHRLFLLGGRPGVTDGVVAWLAREWPGVRVAGSAHGFFAADDEPALVRRIAASGADLLLVALGVPLQEKWIEARLVDCGVRVAMGVGALFDFYSSSVPRAPRWMRRHGMEWAWRLYLEPGRMWRRYVVGNPLFLWRVLREKQTRRRPPGRPR